VTGVACWIEQHIWGKLFNPKHFVLLLSAVKIYEVEPMKYLRGETNEDGAGTNARSQWVMAN
jgi:hypothetical protein